MILLSSVKNLDEREMENKNPVSITYRFGVGMVCKQNSKPFCVRQSPSNPPHPHLLPAGEKDEIPLYPRCAIWETITHQL